MRRVACPQCGAEVVWETAAYRPFCSERCRLVDLGAWLDETYVVPGEPAEPPNAGDDEDQPA